MIAIHPVTLRVGDTEISREELLLNRLEEPEFQVLRTAGWSMLIFRAVDWKDYCGHLFGLAKARHPDWPVDANPQFCTRRPTDGAYLR